MDEAEARRYGRCDEGDADSEGDEDTLDAKDRVDEMRRMVRVRDVQLESNSREHEADIG